MDIFIGFGVVSLLLLCISTYQISKNGWGGIHKYFPGPDQVIGEKIKYSSMWIGKGAYKHSITMTICDEGLHLKMFYITNIFHKPLLIPWDQLYLKKTEYFLGIPIFILSVGESEITILKISQGIYKKIAPYMESV